MTNAGQQPDGLRWLKGRPLLLVPDTAAAHAATIGLVTAPAVGEAAVGA